MSLNYREKTWVSGETVTASDLNAIEAGVTALTNEVNALNVGQLISEIQAEVASIPLNYLELTDEVAELKNELLASERISNASIITVENSTPGEIAIDAQANNEARFIPSDYGEDVGPFERNGVTFTRDNNGVLTINGTPSSFTRYYIIGTSANQKWPIENGKITLSFVSSQPISLEYYYDNTASADRPHINRKTYGTMTIDTPAFTDYTRVVVDLYLITDVEYKDCKVYVALETGETNHNDVICVVNKNLININRPIRTDSTFVSSDNGVYKGVTYSVDYDAGTITLNGTATESFYLTFYQYSEHLMPIKPGTLCVLTGSNSSSKTNGYWAYITFKDDSNNTLFHITDYYKSNTLISSEYYSISSGIRVLSGAVLNNVVFTPMLEIGKERSVFIKQEIQMYSPFFGESNNLTSYEGMTTLFSRTGYLQFTATVKLSFQKYVQSILQSDAREITVCTYNAGVWNYGDRENPLYHGNDMSNAIMRIKNFLSESDIDVLTMQEYRDFFDPEKTFRSLTEIFVPVFSEYFRGNTSEIILSKYPFRNHFKGYVGDEMQRGYSINDILVGNTVVRIINTHLTYNDASARNTQMQHIIDFSLADYTVIMGDFNVADFSEFAPFVSAGLIPANGGYFGDFSTMKSENFRQYDNIWVTPNIQITKVWQTDNDSAKWGNRSEPSENDLPSDHLPLLAKLLIHGSTANTDSEDYEEN